MNGDGLVDLVASSDLIFGSDPRFRECGAVIEDGSDAYTTVLLQNLNTPGTFSAPMRRHLENDRIDTLKLADLNNDFLPDAIVAHRWSGTTIDVLLNDAANPGMLLAENTYTTVSRPNQISAGDIDRDGDIDILIGGEQRAAWHPQSGNGTFNTRNTVSATEHTAVLADFNDDGWLDVATQNGEPDAIVQVHTQSAVMPGQFLLATSIPTDISVWMLGAGDLNNDGQPDLAISGFFFNSSLNLVNTWYRALRTSTQPLNFNLRQPSLNMSSNNFNVAPLVTDLDNDMRNDVVFAGANVITVFLQGSVAAEYTRIRRYTIPESRSTGSGATTAVTVADLNNDTLPDIASVTHGEVWVLFQDQSNPGDFMAPQLIAGELD